MWVSKLVSQVKGRTWAEEDTEKDMWTKRDRKTSDNEELYYLHAIRVIRSRRVRWAGHVALFGTRAHTRLRWGHSLMKGHLNDVGLDERIILK